MTAPRARAARRIRPSNRMLMSLMIEAPLIWTCPNSWPIGPSEFSRFRGSRWSDRTCTDAAGSRSGHERIFVDVDPSGEYALVAYLTGGRLAGQHAGRHLIVALHQTAFLIRPRALAGIGGPPHMIERSHPRPDDNADMHQN